MEANLPNIQVQLQNIIGQSMCQSQFKKYRATPFYFQPKPKCDVHVLSRLQVSYDSLEEVVSSPFWSYTQLQLNACEVKIQNTNVQ